MIEILGQQFDRDELKRMLEAARRQLCYGTLKGKVTQILFRIDAQEREELMAHPNYRPPVIND